jgi:hypothetical protein
MDEMSRQIDAQARLVLVKGGGHGMQLSVSQAPMSLACSLISVSVYRYEVLLFFLNFFFRVIFSEFSFFPFILLYKSTPAIKHTHTHTPKHTHIRRNRNKKHRMLVN